MSIYYNGYTVNNSNNNLSNLVSIVGLLGGGCHDEQEGEGQEDLHRNDVWS